MLRPFFATTLLLVLAYVTPAMAAPKLPDQGIKEATEKLQALIQQNYDQYRAKPETFYAMTDEVVVPHFDQKYIGQIVLGRHWRSATEEQRTRFIAAFKNSLVHSYADAMLDNYKNVKAIWKPVHLAADATDATVSAELQRTNGPALQLGFSVHQAGDEWKVYDVTVDGISLAANFRSQFAAEVRASGIDGLTRRLEGGGKTLQDEDAIKKKPAR